MSSNGVQFLVRNHRGLLDRRCNLCWVPQPLHLSCDRLRLFFAVLKLDFYTLYLLQPSFSWTISTIFNLLDQSGIGRKEETNMVEAEPAANPSWTKYRKAGRPYWKELCQIFGDSYARDDLAVSQSTFILEDVDLEENDMEFLTYLNPTHLSERLEWELKYTMK
ncbi:hypothetical protein NE237_028089 [Protea cynaroides]|uniref:Uncharacterized protein n=1 Tax=Protea cynaroides TaxID=273540 RepID=A0A9Q0JTR4_9MAGN|nr:hypothetical protein NE237_028089 [Protea cynaroides]